MDETTRPEAPLPGRIRGLAHYVLASTQTCEFLRKPSTDPSVNLIRLLSSTNRLRLQGLGESIVAVSLTVLAVLVVAVTGGCDVPAVGGWKPKSAAVSPTLQMVDAVEVASTEDAYQATSFMGSLKPRRSIPLAFTQGGRVKKIDVANGQQVAADQALAQTDTAELDARKVSIETAIESTQQRLNINQNSQDLQNQINDLQRELNEIDQGISNATIKAPFAGVVTKRTVEEGQVVSAGMPVFDLVDSSNLIIEVKVATRIANAMNPGDSIWVLVQGQPFEAAIETVLPTTQTSSRTRTVTLGFRDDQSSQVLNPGDAVEVSYWTQTGKSGFWLPYSVLQQQTSGLWSAMIVEDKGDDTYASARTLDVVQLHDDLALVQGALNPGDRVIVNGLNRIVPGQKIQATLIENAVTIPSPGEIEPESSDSEGSVEPSETSP